MGMGRIVGMTRRFAPDCLDAALYALLLLPIGLIVEAYFAEALGVLRPIAFMAAGGVMLLLRRKAKRAWMFFPAHILPTAPFFFLPGAGRYGWTAAAIIMAAVSVAKRTKEEEGWFDREPLALALMLDFLAYMLAPRFHCPNLSSAAPALAAAILPLFFILRTTLAADDQSDILALEGQQHATTVHRRLLIGFAGVLALLAAFAGRSGLAESFRRALARIGAALRAVLVWLLQLLFRNQEAGVEEIQHETAEKAAGLAELSEDAPPNEILNTIFMGLAMLILLAVTVVTLIGLYRAVVALIRRFYLARQTAWGDYTEPAGDVKTRAAPRPKTPRPRLFDQSAAARARRLFVKAVKQARGRPEATQTAREIERALERQWPTLLTVYEKARYGAEAVTKEELSKAAKELSQKKPEVPNA